MRHVNSGEDVRAITRLWIVHFAALVCMSTLGVVDARADDDPNRDVACVSGQIGVTDAAFRACFLPVNPDPSHDPDGATQRANKAKLLPCLQKANPGLTNKALDMAMDACRPEGPN